MTSPILYPTAQAARLTRRAFLGSTSLAAAALWSGCATGPVNRQAKFAAYPFQLGVASGEPDENSVVLWTRLAPKPLENGGMSDAAVEVSWQIAEDEGMSKVVGRGKQAARPEWAHSVHVEVGGLKPDRWYFYQFKAGSEVSPIGRTRTSPLPHSTPGKLRFAFASCQHYETGLFTAYEHMQRDDVDLVIHLGDYIYEGPGRDGHVRRHFGKELHSLEDYRHRYAQYRSDASLQAMHANAPWFVTWDDHEVDNNYANDISEEAKVPPPELLARRARAYQAYYEHMPLRRSALPKGPDMKLYRRSHFGQLAEFHILDTRQYRTDQPCGDKNIEPCAEALDPKATLMGRKQREWLFGNLARSRAAWNILAQQVMMARVDRLAGERVGYSMDQWPGYEMERRQVLRHFRDARVNNPVVLTGDIHTNWANELLTDWDRPEQQPVAAEFVGTSISSGGDGPDKPGNHASILSENPFVKFFNGERGYVLCEVTPQQWRTEYRTVPVVTRPGGPVVTRASFVLEHGRSALQKA